MIPIIVIFLYLAVIATIGTAFRDASESPRIAAVA